MDLKSDSCKEVIVAVQIGWIDYSKEEKNKIISILRLLKTQGRQKDKPSISGG